MSNPTSVYAMSANHLSRSIIILRGGTSAHTKPTFMSSPMFSSVPWPTPATMTYQEVVSKVAANFYWNILERYDKEKYLEFICQEFIHQTGGRIYKRSERHPSLLEKVGDQDFRKVVMKRFLNLRYKCRDCPGSETYTHQFSTFTKGEKVLADSSANQSFEATYQFDSVINSNYVYLKFDSRSRVMMWEKRLVRAVDLLLSSGERRVTRQMTRQLLDDQTVSPPNVLENGRRNETESTPADTNILEVSDEDTVSDESTEGVERTEIDLTNVDDSSHSDTRNSEVNDAGGSDGNNDNDDIAMGNANRRNVAVGTSTENENSARNQLVPLEENENVDMSYEGLLRRFGVGNENRPKLSREWLRRIGHIPNDCSVDCGICGDHISRGTLLYNINCLCFTRQVYRFCNDCVERFVDTGHSTNCPVCGINLYG